MATNADLSAAALERQSRQLETLDRLSRRFGDSLSGALSTSTSSGRELSGVLDRVASSLASTAGKGIAGSFGGVFSDLLKDAARSLSESLFAGSFGGALPFAKGGVVAGGAAVPFASGGIVAAPTYFPLGRALGLMGERGAEAILPLARGPDGRLGVRSGGEAAGATHVTVNISATDLESFKRSEAQVTAALARAVARGRRAL